MSYMTIPSTDQQAVMKCLRQVIKAGGALHSVKAKPLAILSDGPVTRGDSCPILQETPPGQILTLKRLKIRACARADLALARNIGNLQPRMIIRSMSSRGNVCSIGIIISTQTLPFRSCAENWMNE